jgi:putative ABC transport system ATP-binding protein
MITATGITKIFRKGSVETHVLRGVSVAIKQGEFVAIMGKSGAGKSTLLYQLSLLDHPTAGSILVDGVETELLSHEERTAFRLARLGYVFQDYALLPELTALENVMLPMLMQGMQKKIAEHKSMEALTKVGLSGRFNNIPSALSGGEQQRVGIARAIAHAPKILFADEPTANLDNESSRVVMAIFQQLRQQGQTIVMVTHEEEYGLLADRIIRLDDGRVISDR